MSSNVDVIIVLVDQKLNIVTIPDGSNSSFIKTKIELKDYPFDNNLEMAAKNAALRHMRDVYSLYLSKDRLFDASLVDDNGVKTYLFIYKLDTTERLTIQMTPNISFISVTNLPTSLNPISSSVAVAITNYFDILKKTPNPPGLITLNYPVQVPIFVPVYTVPVLRPVIFYQPQQPQQPQQKPQKTIHLSDNIFASESEGNKKPYTYENSISEKKSAPKIPRTISENKPISEKKVSPKIVKPISEKKVSPKIVKPISEKRVSPKIIKPISEKKVSPKYKSEVDAINRAKGLEKQRSTPKSQIQSEREKRKLDKKNKKSSSKTSSVSSKRLSSTPKSSSVRKSTPKSSSVRKSTTQSASVRKSTTQSSSIRKSTPKSSSSKSSSSKSSSSKSSSSKSSSSKKKSSKKRSSKKKGGYYDKYLKYKMKYLKVQKKMIELLKNN